jgi:TPR repeat protein
MAAYQGLPAGQHALGRCLERGDGVEMNAEEAVTWYRLAVDASYAPAIESLGASHF